MSKFDKSPLQERLIEIVFDVVKANGRLSTRLIDDLVEFRLGLRLSNEDRNALKKRLGWTRVLLSSTGFIERELYRRAWRLAVGGESVAGVVGKEVIATRSAMRKALYPKE